MHKECMLASMKCIFPVCTGRRENVCARQYARCGSNSLRFFRKKTKDKERERKKEREIEKAV